MIFVRYWIFSELKVLGRASLQVWYSIPNLPLRIDLKRSPSPWRSLIHRVVGIFEFSSRSRSRSLLESLSISLTLTLAVLLLTSFFLWKGDMSSPIWQEWKNENNSQKEIDAVFRIVNDSRQYNATIAKDKGIAYKIKRFYQTEKVSCYWNGRRCKQCGCMIFRWKH